MEPSKSTKNEICNITTHLFNIIIDLEEYKRKKPSILTKRPRHTFYAPNDSRVTFITFPPLRYCGSDWLCNVVKMVVLKYFNHGGIARVMCGRKKRRPSQSRGNSNGERWRSSMTVQSRPPSTFANFIIVIFNWYVGRIDGHCCMMIACRCSCEIACATPLWVSASSFVGVICMFNRGWNFVMIWFRVMWIIVFVL